MPSETRRVEVAAGHAVNVRLARHPSPRPGFVRVVKSHRAPFDISADRWAASEVVR